MSAWPMSEFFGSSDLADCEVQLFIQSDAEEEPKAKRVKVSSNVGGCGRSVIRQLPGHRLALMAASSKFRSLLDLPHTQDLENQPPSNAQLPSPEASKPGSAKGGGWFNWGSNSAAGHPQAKPTDSTSASAKQHPVLEMNIRLEAWLPSALAALRFFYAGPSVLSNLEQGVLCPMVILGAELGAKTLVEAVIDQLLHLGTQQCGFKLGLPTERALISLQKEELESLKSSEFGDKFNRLYTSMQACVLDEYKDLEGAWSDSARRAAFLDLPFGAVLHVLMSNETQVASENTACLAAGAWLALHRESTSNADAYALLASIQLHQCSPSFLANVLPRLPLWGLLDKGRMIDLLYNLGHEVTGRSRERAPARRCKSSMTEVNLQWELDLGSVRRALEQSAEANGATCLLSSQAVIFCGFAWSLQLELSADDCGRDNAHGGGGNAQHGVAALGDDVAAAPGAVADDDDEDDDDDDDDEYDGGLDSKAEEDKGGDVVELEAEEEEEDDNVVELDDSTENDSQDKDAAHDKEPLLPIPSVKSSRFGVICQVPDVPLSRGASVGSFTSGSVTAHPVLANCCHVTISDSSYGTASLAAEEADSKRHLRCHQVSLSVRSGEGGSAVGSECSKSDVIPVDVGALSEDWMLWGTGKVVGPII